MSRNLTAAWLALAILRGLAAQGPPPQDDIDAAIDRGVAWLLRCQETDGAWRGPDIGSYPTGATALAVYTLLKCGLEPDHPAVRAGLAWMQSRPCERTYSAGLTLMAYEALGEARPRKEVQKIAEFLLKSAKGALWAYPAGNPDLSNTQYAVLGLRAAAACGVAVPAALWSRIAAEILRAQESYGGFGYRPGTPANASMTAAGLSCLLVAEAQARKAGAVPGNVRAGIERGLQWFERRWSVAENLEDSKTGKGPERWLYYYLYGLERVGAYAGLDRIGGHDWYAEGATVLLKKQGGEGAWSVGGWDPDIHTCFALLFLRRGSRQSGLPSRVLARMKEEKDAPVQVATNGRNPVVAWIRAFGPAVQDRLAGGAAIAGVDWELDGAVAATVPLPAGADPRKESFTWRETLATNGVHRIRAALRLAEPDGAPAAEPFRSAPLSVTVDDVEEPWQADAIRDAGRNLLAPDNAEVAASTQYDHDRRKELVADRTCCTQWLSAAGDREPWIQVTLKRPLRAGAVRFCVSHPYGAGVTAYARPKDVEVVVNGTQTFALALPDGVRAWHRIPFKPLTVGTVKIRIRSRYPGKEWPDLAGIKEIELLP